MLYECPVSLGEIIDKITILEIKAVEIKSTEQAKNVHAELSKLKCLVSAELLEYRDLYQQLSTINLELWHIEDLIRDCESNQCFDDSFVRLARSVYFKNDERGRIKRQINAISGSTLIEEKQYSQY